MASELRPIEEVVEDILDRRGVTPFKLGGDFTSAGHRVISAKLVKGGRIDLAADEPRYVDSTIYKKWMKNPLRRDDVIMTSEAPLGELAYLDHSHDWVLGQRLFAIRPRKDVLSGKFLYYVLATQGVRERIIARASGTTVQGIRQAELRKVEIPVPSLAVQLEAAEVLGAIDDRIDNLRQANATLEAIAQALFKSWFVDFDPVRAKSEGREPEGMDAATAALFPSEFEDSELGPIPKGWSVGASDDLLEVLGGGTPKTSVPEYWDGDIPWFSVVDAPASGQVFTMDTAKKITAFGLQNCSAKLLPEMTTIISARGTVGKVAMTGVPMAMNQSCYALRPKVEGGESFVHFSTLRFVEQLQRIAHGAVFDTITRDSFKRIITSLPPDEVIEAFGTISDSLLQRIRANGQQAITLTNIRDTLLPRLISGKLRLPGAEVLIDRAHESAEVA